MAHKSATPKRRSAPKPSVATNVAKVMSVPRGWETQTCQLGGVPAIAVYRKGRFTRATALQTPSGVHKRQAVPKAALQRLPKRSWRYDDHAVVGQVRAGVFEALAIASVTGRTLLAANGFNSLYDTPSSRRIRLPGATATVSQPTPLTLTPISVISTLYRNRMLLHWYDREKGKRLFTLVLRRRVGHAIASPALDTRPSKGGNVRTQDKGS